MKSKSIVRLFLFTILFILLLSLPLLAKEIFIRTGTSSVGGGFYQIGNTITQLGNRVLKDYNFTAVTGGSVKNCYNLDKKEIELGIVQSATLQDAWTGKGSFDGEPIKSLRWITAIYPMPFHVLVNLKSGISSIDDFKGKRVDIGPVGGGIEVNAKKLLAFYNISFDDLNIQRFGRSEVSEALKTGRSEAHIWATNAPNAMISDMIHSKKVGLIGIEPEKIDEIVKELPAFAKVVIPAGTYEGYNNDIPVIAPVGSLLTYADMDEETIYKITKTLFENVEFLKDRLNYFNSFKIENSLNGMTIPLHPGAEKYYKEISLIK